jgi:ketosteroid isomerase-like protein
MRIMDEVDKKIPAEDEIGRFIDTMSRYARTRNVDGLMSLYHPSATSFEFGAQTGLINLDEIRRNCERGYAAIGGAFEYEFTPFKIEVGGDLAYMYGTEQISGETNNNSFEYTVKATYCLKQVGGQWLIYHQHLSMDG